MEYKSAELAGLVAGRNEHGCWRYDPTLAQTILIGPGHPVNEGLRREDLIRRNYHLSYLGRDRSKGEPSCLLADYGYVRFASVITTDLTFVAVGDLVQEELVRVVEGLRRQGKADR